MKQLTWFSVLAAGVLVAQPLLSQTSRPQRSTRDELQGLKAANLKMIEQQAATLQKLEEMQKEAQQLRIFVRRS